jgi:hypothetical protein
MSTLTRNVAGGLALGLCLGTPMAHAEFKLRYPQVEYREMEIEHNGDTTFDKANSGKSNNQSYTNELEYGITRFLKLGIEGESAAPPGRNLRYQGTALEGTFQLTPEGKYWADFGFFAEYEQAHARDEANAFTFGPLIQKEVPNVFGIDTVHTLNLLVTKEAGPHHSDDTPLLVAWQSRLRVNPLFEPGVELFSQIDNITSPGKLAEQQHRLGPMFAGAYSLAPHGNLKYEVGYLFGLTHATEQGTVRWRLEYEIPF